MVIDVFAARKRLNGIAKWTPLVHSKTFSKWSKNKVYLKLENLQVAGSFKIRGAYNKISQLSKKEKKKGVIASSTGNHAQAVAYAATKLKVKSTIVMPEYSPLTKITATKGYGAKVILHGKIYDDAYEEAKKLKNKLGLTFVHPYNDEDVLSGQGTIGLEIIEDLQKTDYIFVPIGGGGLISGIAIAAKAVNPKVKVVGVQAEGANPIRIKNHKFKLKEIKEINTIADGIAVKHPGDLTLALINKYVDKIVTVNDDEISDVLLALLERSKYLVEPAGAVSLAAIVHKKIKIKNKNVVAVISGGNIDIKTLDALLKKGMVKQGRLLEVRLTITDKPGEFDRLLKILSEDRAAIIHAERITKVKVGQSGVDLILETEGQNHVKGLIKKLNKEGFKVEN